MHAPPIIVLGAPGAAPSRVTAMLGAHPDAIALPELRLFMADTIGELLQIFEIAGSGYADGLLRLVALLENGGESDEQIEIAGQWLRRRAEMSGSALLDYFCERLAPRRVIVVDTETGWHPAAMRRLKTGCPDASLLHLTRHPRPWCRETAENLSGRLFVAPDYKDYAVSPPVIDPQLAWLRIHRNLDVLLGEFDSSRTLCLRLEDLHLDPEPTLGHLLQWAGLNHSGAALAAMQAPERGRFSRFGPPAAPGGFDAAFLRQPGFERWLSFNETLPGLIEWRSGARQLDPELVGFAQSSGYR